MASACSGSVWAAAGEDLQDIGGGRRHPGLDQALGIEPAVPGVLGVSGGSRLPPARPISPYSRALRSSSTRLQAAASSSSPAKWRTCSSASGAAPPQRVDVGHVLQLQQAAQRAPERRLAQVLGRRVAPHAAVLDFLVDHHRLPAAAIVVRELRIEAADRIEPVVQVEPAAAHLLVRKTVVPRPARVELVPGSRRSRRGCRS